MILLSSSQKYLFIALAIVVFVIVVGIVVTIILKKKNNGHVRVDDLFIENIITYLGNKDNIEDVLVDNARLKVCVKDVDKIDGEKLHTLSEKGVFISGNNVKLLFKYDSQLIKKEILKRL